MGHPFTKQYEKSKLSSKRNKGSFNNIVSQLVKLGVAADVAYVIFTLQIHPLDWTGASGGPVMALGSYVCHP